MSVRISGTEFSVNASSGGLKEVLVTGRGRLVTYAVSQTVQEVESIYGNSFNMNTGFLSGITTANSGLAYYKHSEDLPFIVDTIIVGTTAVATAAAQPLKVIKNPTTGTLISDANAGTIVNRNFGSSNALSNSVFYIPAAPDAETVTDGSDYLFAYVGSNTRTVLSNLSTVLEKGSSIAVTMSPTEALDCYVAIVGHLFEV